MVHLQDSELFPASSERVWELLKAHNDPAVIRQIHPLILSQQVVSQQGEETILERVIDARGRHLTSRWKITLRPPEYGRWEILDGPGPWAPGSFVESRYRSEGTGTRIDSTAELKILVLPRIFPQGSFVRRVVADIDREDQAYLSRRP